MFLFIIILHFKIQNFHFQKIIGDNHVMMLTVQEELLVSQKTDLFMITVHVIHAYNDRNIN